MNLSKVLAKLSLYVASIICVTLACRFIFPPELVLREVEYFEFNPNTIIEELSQGNYQVFTSRGNQTPEVYSSIEPNVKWGVDGYWQVAQSLFPEIKEDSLSSWNLFVFNMQWNCSSVADGPQDSFMSYFKIEEREEQNVQVITKINIEPKRKTTFIVTEEYSPHYGDQPFIDLGKLQIGIDDAFSIAERNGGEAARLSVDNKCLILAGINSASEENWSVTYIQYSNLTLAEYIIDAESGEIIEN